MNIFIKVFLLLCQIAVIIMVYATTVRFYETNRTFMFLAGMVVLLYLGSMLFNSFSVLLFKGV